MKSGYYWCRPIDGGPWAPYRFIENGWKGEPEIWNFDDERPGDPDWYEFGEEIVPPAAYQVKPPTES